MCVCTVHISNETDANVILGSVLVPVKHSSGTEITTKRLLKASNSSFIIEVSLDTFLHVYFAPEAFRMKSH